jgi:hypothetical protein
VIKDSSEKTARKGMNSTTAQGRVVERIVALMHEQPGVTVERNKFLPPVHGKGRKREIDVLITGDLAGYPIQIAIECKDEAEAIGSPRIDAFVGKLHYLGISSRQSIYVSAHGYTTGAKERAEEAGIKLLTLRHLTDADLVHSIAGAFQSTIYLLLQVAQMEVSGGVPPPYWERALSFFDADGNLAALLPDFIWQKWMMNEIPLPLGEHELSLPLPTNLRQMVNGNAVETFEAKAKVRILGVIVTLEGQTKGYQLISALNEAPERVFYDFSLLSSHALVAVLSIGLRVSALYVSCKSSGACFKVERFRSSNHGTGKKWREQICLRYGSLFGKDILLVDKIKEQAAPNGPLRNWWQRGGKCIG